MKGTRRRPKLAAARRVSAGAFVGGTITVIIEIVTDLACRGSGGAGIDARCADTGRGTLPDTTTGPKTIHRAVAVVVEVVADLR